MAFETNVFINCPFDQDYKPLLKSILFAVICCGYEPQLSENKDSGESRIINIQNLIKDSQYSIHDLSRMEAETAGQLARLNMPFELGLDIGCRRYKGGKHSGKKSLILDKTRYRYQKALSDMSGSDISDHNNSPEKIAIHVRNWLQKQQSEDNLILLNGTTIWEWFNEFEGNFESMTKAADRDEMPWNEYNRYMHDFITAKREK